MKHEVALWAGLSAFFSNIIALKAIDLINGGGMTVQFIAAIVTSLVVAGAVYAKQRLDEAKSNRNGHS